MSNYATSIGDPGRREKRPPTLVTAEVTRKKSQVDADESVDTPPAFNGKKLRGAKRFLDHEPLVADETEDDGVVEGFENLPGVRLETSSRSSTSTVPDEKRHPLAAPAGWRRYWGKIDKDNWDDEDIILSLFCKCCYDENNAHSCVPHEQYHSSTILFNSAKRGEKYLSPCTDCQRSGHECLFLITYKAPTTMGTYKSRKLERERAHADTIGLAVPTCDATFSPVVRLPPKLETPQRTPAEPAQPRKQPTAPVAAERPTYSKVRDSYHHLKSWAMSKSGRGRIKHKGVAWVHDQQVHHTVDYDRMPQRQTFSSLPPSSLPPPPLVPRFREVERARQPWASSRATSTRLQEREKLLNEMRTLCTVSVSEQSEQERKERLLKEMTRLCALSIREMALDTAKRGEADSSEENSF